MRNCNACEHHSVQEFEPDLSDAMCGSTPAHQAKSRHAAGSFGSDEPWPAAAYCFTASTWITSLTVSEKP